MSSIHSIRKRTKPQTIQYTEELKGDVEPQDDDKTWTHRRQNRKKNSRATPFRLLGEGTSPSVGVKPSQTIVEVVLQKTPALFPSKHQKPAWNTEPERKDLASFKPCQEKARTHKNSSKWILVKATWWTLTVTIWILNSAISRNSARSSHQRELAKPLSQPPLPQ